MTSCKYDGQSKSFEFQYIKLKLFIVCILVKGTFYAYSSEQVVDVT